MGSRTAELVRVSEWMRCHWMDHPFHQTDHDLEGGHHQDSVYWGRSLSFSQVVAKPVVPFWAWLETFVLGIQT